MAVSEMLGQLAGTFEKEYQDAKKANIERYVEAKNLYEQNIAQFAPGGAFGAGFESQLADAKRQDVGQAMQHQISAGLFGVQSTGALGQQWESKVGAPARLKLEDMRMDRISGARKDLAGVIERREDEYPDFRLIADLYERASAAQTGKMNVTLPPNKTAREMYQDVMGQTGGYGTYSMGGSSGGAGGYSGGGAGGAGGSYPSGGSIGGTSGGGFQLPPSVSSGASGGASGGAPAGYETYIANLQSRQPGAVAPTQSEYQQIQDRMSISNRTGEENVPEYLKDYYGNALTGDAANWAQFVYGETGKNVRQASLGAGTHARLYRKYQKLKQSTAAGGDTQVGFGSGVMI